MLLGDKYRLASDVGWETPASNSCGPQQWNQDCFGDIQWQLCPDTENGLKCELTQAEGNINATLVSLHSIHFHEACCAGLAYKLQKYIYSVAKWVMDALWVGVSCNNSSSSLKS